MSRLGNSGFTLVEMLFVLAIAGLTAFGIGYFNRSPKVTLVSFVEQLNVFLEAQRFLALGSATANNLEMHEGHRQLRSSFGDRFIVPDAIELVMRSSVTKNERPIIVFLPDGCVLGGQFDISSGAKEISVYVQ